MASTSELWTREQQRRLESALRDTRASRVPVRERWDRISRAVGRPPRECAERCRSIAAALRSRSPPPLLRLNDDDLLLVLERLGGPDLCAFASSSKAHAACARHRSLWLALDRTLPPSLQYDTMERGGEEVWAYVLRVRRALHGAWHRLKLHQAGHSPYLAEIGSVVGGSFTPTGGVLPYRLKYGAVAELVQLQVRRDGERTTNAATYKAVAEFITRHSPDSRSFSAPIHMTVREIFKVCYPGFGSGVGATGVAPGVRAGGSSTSGGASGAFVGKGVATMTKRLGDEELRKRLDTEHVFFALISH
mmetsp:Transcript_14314/g.45974  ORF Transcript_14314/g.45974 Transcript_14314/m.45974 type:complete len:305 (+) Transcript_14314:53-967(+)